MKRIRNGVALALAAILASCSTSYDRPSIKAEKDRRKAPDFALENAAGKAFKLSDYKGRVVLLNFWATWCGPCQEEIPWFMAFEKDYKDRGFAVLGVSFDDDGWDAVTPYAKRRKMNYTLAVGTEGLLQLYGNTRALPTTFLIDREGRIAAVHIGLASRNTYQQEILTLIGKDPDDTKSTSRLHAPGGPGADLRAR